LALSSLNLAQAPSGAINRVEISLLPFTLCRDFQNTEFNFISGREATLGESLTLDKDTWFYKERLHPNKDVIRVQAGNIHALAALVGLKRDIRLLIKHSHLLN